VPAEPRISEAELTSAFLALSGQRVAICVVFIGLMVLANLRGAWSRPGSTGPTIAGRERRERRARRWRALGRRGTAPASGASRPPESLVAGRPPA
jgi:hypothetical protein